MSATHSTLERGGACLRCRGLKVKCDGARPACSRCSRIRHAEACEYTDSMGRAENQNLEDSIARLEARIQQLGGRLPTSPDLVIHEPHSHGQFPGSSFSAWNFRNSSRPQETPRIQLTLPDNWWQASIPPHNVTSTLMDHFSRHASQLGFFLNGPRLLKSVFSSDPRYPISPRLLNVMLLFGIHLSGSPALKAQESTFLGRALQFDAPILPHQVTHNIQTEALLAQYFLRECRFLEAMHHINSAVSLCIGSRLHQMPDQYSSPDTARNALSLLPSRDAVEQGERVNAVWSVMSAHRIFSVVMHWPSMVSDVLDDQLNLPWPLEMSIYESGIIPINPEGALTMKAFLDGRRTAESETAISLPAQHAKAAALFERASVIGASQTNLSDPDEYTQFILFEYGLNQVIQSLPAFDEPIPASNDVARQRLVTFTLCHVAIIQLHSAVDDPASIHKCLNAAHAVVAANQRFPDIQTWEHVDSSMGTLWVAICQVFIRGIATIRNRMGATRAWAASVSTSDYPALEAALANITDIMAVFSTQCRLIDYQLSQVNELYQALFR